MFIFGWGHTLLGLAVLSFFSSAHGQSAWPDADDVFRVEVIVFERPTGATVARAQQGHSRFDDALRLRPFKPEPARRSEAAPQRSPQPVEEWLAWLEDQALAHSAEPLVGPPERLHVPEPLLNAPFLWQQPARHPASLAQALARLERAADYRVVSAHSWYQPLPRSGRSQAVRIGPLQASAHAFDTAPAAPPWPVAQAGGPDEWFDGQVQLSRGPFLRAELALAKHTPSRRDHGPLRGAFLAPTGHNVEQMEANRVIDPERWVYFDHPRLGVLLRVTPWLSIP